MELMDIGMQAAQNKVCWGCARIHFDVITMITILSSGMKVSGDKIMYRDHRRIKSVFYRVHDDALHYYALLIIIFTHIYKRLYRQSFGRVG